MRVVRVGDFSTELCGGTHLDRTGEMGLFRIISETGVAAGIRRIEALTGRGAYELVKKEEAALSRISESLGTTSEDVVSKLDKLIDEQKALRKRVRQLESKLASASAVKLVGKARMVEGIQVISSRVEASDIAGLRQMADETRARLKGNCIGVFASDIEGKAVFVAFVTEDLIDRIKAGDIAREVAKLAGGGGGGKPTIAESGGKDVGRIDEAMSRVPQIVEALLEDAR